MAFSTGVAPSREDQFWQWFAANEARLFDFESDREAVLDALREQLSRLNDNLTFESGPVEDGRREFVISAGGIQAAFPAAEALYGKAPPLPRWIWVKFRPRRLPINDLVYAGKTVIADEVRYLLAKAGDKAAILLFLDGYNDAEKNILLDEALGEYAVATWVGVIKLESRDSQLLERSHPLPELPRHFDEFLARRVH
jgi:hypothetical protein